MKHVRPDHFRRFDRMSLPFLKHFDGFVDLLGIKYAIQPNGEYRKDDKGPHGQGIAIDFRLSIFMTFYSQAIKVLNACNEYFHNRNGMKYRLGAYPELEKPGFHLDIVQEKLFWIARYKRDENGMIDRNSRLTYKYYRDEAMLLTDLDEER